MSRFNDLPEQFFDNLPGVIRNRFLERQDLQKSVRSVLFRKLEQLEVVPLYLPQCSQSKPVGMPTVPILITDPSHLFEKQHVIIVAGEDRLDCGIFGVNGYIGDETTKESCSAIGFLQELQNVADNNSTGVIFANPGELIWIPSIEKGVNTVEWLAHAGLNQTGVKDEFGPGPDLTAENLIPGHETYVKHLVSVFHFAVAHAKLDAMFSIITHGRAASTAVSGWLQSRDDPDDLYLKRIRNGLVGIVWVGEYGPDNVDRTIVDVERGIEPLFEGECSKSVKEFLCKDTRVFQIVWNHQVEVALNNEVYGDFKVPYLLAQGLGSLDFMRKSYRKILAFCLGKYKEARERERRKSQAR